MSHRSPPSLCAGAAGLAETFPSLPVSGSFLPDLPMFLVSSDSVCQWPIPPWSSNLSCSSDSVLPGSSSTALLLHIISATALMFSVSCLFTCPNRYNLLSVLPSLPPRSPHFSNVPVGSHPLPIAPSSSLLLPFGFNPLLTFDMFRSRKAMSAEPPFLISGVSLSLE